MPPVRAAGPAQSFDAHWRHDGWLAR